MNVRRGAIIVCALFVGLSVISNYLLWSKLRAVRDSSRFEQDNSRSRDIAYFRFREMFEGRHISDIVPNFRFHQPRSPVAAGTILVGVNSLECATCFEYHAERIRRLYLDCKVRVVLYGVGLHAILAKSALPFGSLVEDSSVVHHIGKTEGIPTAINFFVFLVNEGGQVVYGDVANSSDYSRSEAFYAIVGNYLRSGRNSVATERTD